MLTEHELKLLRGAISCAVPRDAGVMAALRDNGQIQSVKLVCYEDAMPEVKILANMRVTGLPMRGVIGIMGA